MALVDQTRKQLRQRVARRVGGDGLNLTATGNGTTTTFVDALNVNTGTESFDGREIIFTSGSNDGLVSGITGTSSNTLTFTPSRTSTATSDTAEVYNKRGRGFLVQEYHAAINDAIEEANHMVLVPTIASISAAYDEDTQTFAVPSTLFEAYRVEFEDSDGIWQLIKPAGPRGGNGWTAEPENAVVRIEGNPASYADGYNLRVHGFTRHSSLTAESSVCSFDGEFIVNCAAYHLALMGLDRDPKYGVLVPQLKMDYERAKGRIRMNRPAGTVRVRL